MEVRSNRQSRPPALAVQPVRYINHQVQILESKARMTSVCLSEASTDPAEPGPTVPTTPDYPTDLQALQTKASSVLLGEECWQDSHRNASPWSHTLREHDSSSTLRTYYEPRKIPLNISQQTSESSARDLALRKGYPVVASVPGRSRQSPPQSQYRESPKSSIQSGDKGTGSERMDVSTLFPRPETARMSKLPHDESPVLPRRSKYFSSALLSTPKLRLRNVENDVPAGAQKAKKSQRSQRMKQQTGISEGMSYYKTNVRRPKVGIKNWFDTFDDDLSDPDINDEPDVKPDFVDRLETVFHSMSSPVTPASIPESLQAFRNTPPPAKSQLHIVPVDALESANLHEQSVLCLSSSDEDDRATELPMPQKRRVLPAIRNSLALHALDDSDPEVGTARAVSTMGPINQARSMPYHMHGKPPATILVPPRQSSKTGASQDAQQEASRMQRGHQKRRSSVRNVPRVASEGWLDSPARPARALDTAEGSIQVGVSHSESDDQSSPRLMAVTRQEELLLAAMRAKRANMHASPIEQDFRRNREEQLMKSAQSSHRPHTSSADMSAPAFVEMGTNKYADWVRRRRSSLITDAQFNRESVTTIQTSSSPPRTSVHFSPQHSSGSHSHHSPTTPPSHSEAQGEWRSSTGLGTYFSLSSDDLHTHSRSRTDSSHIVVLDDLDNSPKNVRGSGLDNYTYNEWRPPPITIVH